MDEQFNMEEELKFGVEVELYVEGSEQARVQTVVLGHEPVVVMRPVLDEEAGTLTLKVQSSMIAQDVDGLKRAISELLELLDAANLEPMEDSDDGN